MADGAVIIGSKSLAELNEVSSTENTPLSSLAEKEKDVLANEGAAMNDRTTCSTANQAATSTPSMKEVASTLTN